MVVGTDRRGHRRRARWGRVDVPGGGVGLTPVEQAQLVGALSVAFMVARLNVGSWWEAEQLARGFLQALSRQGIECRRVAGNS